MASIVNRKKCVISNANIGDKRWWTEVVKMSSIRGHVERSTIVENI